MWLHFSKESGSLAKRGVDSNSTYLLSLSWVLNEGMQVKVTEPGTWHMSAYNEYCILLAISKLKLICLIYISSNILLNDSPNSYPPSPFFLSNAKIYKPHSHFVLKEIIFLLLPFFHLVSTLYEPSLFQQFNLCMPCQPLSSALGHRGNTAGVSSPLDLTVRWNSQATLCHRRGVQGALEQPHPGEREQELHL